MNRVVGVVVSAVSLVCLVACTPSEPEPSTSPTVSSTPTATPTPTPTREVQDQSDAAMGIVFEQVPDLTGDEAAVYNTLATYNKEYWRTMTTNEVSPAFSILASADVQATMQRIATNNTSSQVVIGGVFRTRVGDVAVDGDTATGTICDVYSDVTFSNVDGPATPEEAGFGEPRHKVISLARIAAENRWVIQTSEVEGTC